MKGEFEFINDIRRLFPSPPEMKGIGDDCAIIPQSNGYETLVSTDMMVEGTHFLRKEISPYQLGWKSAASSFSDIAAMGGKPSGSFLALALPRNLPKGWEPEFIRGYRDISDLCAFPLLGGDTTSSPDRISVCVTVLGRAVTGHSLRRNTARVGDLICITGSTGDAAAGLEAVLRHLNRDDDAVRLIERHYLPRPRMEEGLKLAATDGVHAMMDISDGIGSDLRHIMEESSVGAEVDLTRVPLSEPLRRFCDKYGYDPYRFALAGGEDYELLFTLSPEAVLDVPHTVIGRITEGSSLVWLGSDKDYMGFRHF